MRCCALLCLLLPAARAEDFVVSGRFEYQDKAWDYDGWTGADPNLPIRRADVTVMDASSQRVLGRGATDDSGEFAVSCTTKQSVLDVTVRVDAASLQAAQQVHAFPRLRVQTPAHDQYSAWSEVHAGHASSEGLDIGTTTVLRMLVGDRDGNPFNAFDMAVAAFDYVIGPEVGMTRPGRTVTLTWPNPTGSYSMGRRAWIGSGDGYDDAVILHELGHIVHNAYSDSDNPGGYHFFGDSDQDLRLAFGEGWATAFAGVVLERMGAQAAYVDSNASKQLGGYQLRLDLETTAPYQVSAWGAGDEVAVACVLYDLLDDANSGDDELGLDDDSMPSGALVAGVPPTRALWQLFTGPLRKASRVNIDHLWDAWVVAFDDPLYDRLQDVFRKRRMEFWNDAFEPDDTPLTAGVLTPSSGSDWGPERSLYSSAPGSLGPGTGDQDWFALDLQAGQVVTIETRYPDGASDAGTQTDTFLALYTPDGRRLAKDDDSGYRRNALLEGIPIAETGSFRLLVRSRNKLNRYGLYNVRLQIVGS